MDQKRYSNPKSSWSSHVSSWVSVRQSWLQTKGSPAQTGMPRDGWAHLSQQQCTTRASKCMKQKLKKNDKIIHQWLQHSSLTNWPLLFSHWVVSDSATPWTAARQASPSITTSQSLLRLLSIESVMPSNHLILCRALLLLPSIFSVINIANKQKIKKVVEYPNDRHRLTEVYIDHFTQQQQSPHSL